MTRSHRSAPTVAALLFAWLCASDCLAEARPPNIRIEGGVEAAMADGTQSSTFRALVARIEQSDLVVYVRCQVFDDPELYGRLALLGATPLSRYAVIELACDRPRLALGATLGHELRHAVEVATAPGVNDPASLKRLYERIGFRTWRKGGASRYDTTAAIDTGSRVFREIQQAFDSAARHDRNASEEVIK